MAAHALQGFQWRVTWYEEGEDPVVEIWERFADAWADAMPDGDEVGWLHLRKSSVRDRFANGEITICVAWRPNADRRIMERV